MDGSGSDSFNGDEAPEELTTSATQSCAIYNEIKVGGEILTECVTLDRCPSILESPTDRIIAPCGFDEGASLMMVCCPASRVTNSTSPQIKPRYPQANGEPRPVEDRTPEHCQRWKNNGACRQDIDSHCLEEGCDLTVDQNVPTEELFPFMMSACMESCGWGKKVMTK